MSFPKQKYWACCVCALYIEKRSPAAEHFLRVHKDCAWAFGGGGASLVWDQAGLGGVEEPQAHYRRAYGPAEELALAGRGR